MMSDMGDDTSQPLDARKVKKGDRIRWGDDPRVLTVTDVKRDPDDFFALKLTVVPDDDWPDLREFYKFPDNAETARPTS